LKYDLVYTQRAVKDIQKLDAPVKARLGKTLLRYKEAPLDHEGGAQERDLQTKVIVKFFELTHICR
jgi:hypothetical protein